MRLRRMLLLVFGQLAWLWQLKDMPFDTLKEYAPQARQFRFFRELPTHGKKILFRSEFFDFCMGEKQGTHINAPSTYHHYQNGSLTVDKLPVSSLVHIPGKFKLTMRSPQWTAALCPLRSFWSSRSRKWGPYNPPACLGPWGLFHLFTLPGQAPIDISSTTHFFNLTFTFVFKGI